MEAGSGTSHKRPTTRLIRVRGRARRICTAAKEATLIETTAPEPGASRNRTAAAKDRSILRRTSGGFAQGAQDLRVGRLGRHFLLARDFRGEGSQENADFEGFSGLFLGARAPQLEE